MSRRRTILRGVLILIAGVALQSVDSLAASFVGFVLILVGWVPLANHLMSTPARHWSVFNILCRLAGLGSTTTGVVFILQCVYLQSHPEETRHINTLSGSAVLDFCLVGLFAVGVGILLLSRRAYRPDFGDAVVGDRVLRIALGLPKNWRKPRAPEPGPRTWWTGENKPPEAPAKNLELP